MEIIFLNSHIFPKKNALNTFKHAMEYTNMNNTSPLRFSMKQSLLIVNDKTPTEYHDIAVGTRVVFEYFDVTRFEFRSGDQLPSTRQSMIFLRYSIKYKEVSS
jgi:hypothetical protein